MVAGRAIRGGRGRSLELDLPQRGHSWIPLRSVCVRLLPCCDALATGRTNTTASLLAEWLGRKCKRHRIACPSAHIQQIAGEIRAVEVDVGIRICPLIDLADVERKTYARIAEASHTRPDKRCLEPKSQGIPGHGTGDVDEHSWVWRIGHILVAAKFERRKGNRDIDRGCLS